ncbi:MAG: DUF2293 domain-containing protein [Victivallaceae bacterium]
MANDNENRNVFRSNFVGKIKLNSQDIPIPAGWGFAPSGDAALTRRIKAGNEYYQLVHHKRNRLENLGIYAPQQLIEQIQADLVAERNSETYRKKLDSSRRHREKQQLEYSAEFTQAVADFLNFAPCYKEYELKFATVVAKHATPVGSGTVARTKMISVPERAEAAVIAWMRHQTTAYDEMKIARIKGERRSVRRELAEQSRKILTHYRCGDKIDFESCPLNKALQVATSKKTPNDDI